MITRYALKRFREWQRARGAASAALDSPEPDGALPRSGTSAAPRATAAWNVAGAVEGHGQPVIEARQLVKRYGSLTAVDGVSFAVEAGEIFGLLGPNGAGKTTTLEMLEGLRQPDAGEATVLGASVVQHPRRIKQRIGVQLQSTALPPDTTVTEAMDLFGAFYRQRRPTAQLLQEFPSGRRR